MKNYLRTFLLFVVVLGGSSFGFAQIKTGGYKKVPTDNAGVVAAADFAVEAQAEKTEAGIELVGIKKAEQQTVAGANFKLCIEVNIADGSTDEPNQQFANVVVFRSLKNEFSLKNWTETEDCNPK